VLHLFAGTRVLVLALLLIQAVQGLYRQNRRTAPTGSTSAYKGKVQVLVKGNRTTAYTGSISAYKGTVLLRVKAKQYYCS